MTTTTNCCVYDCSDRAWYRVLRRRPCGHAVEIPAQWANEKLPVCLTHTIQFLAEVDAPDASKCPDCGRRNKIIIDELFTLDGDPIEPPFNLEHAQLEHRYKTLCRDYDRLDALIRTTEQKRGAVGDEIVSVRQKLTRMEDEETPR